MIRGITRPKKTYVTSMGRPLIIVASTGRVVVVACVIWSCNSMHISLVGSASTEKHITWILGLCM